MISEKLKAAILAYAKTCFYGPFLKGKVEAEKALEAEIEELHKYTIKAHKDYADATTRLNHTLMGQLQELRSNVASPEHRPFDLEAAKRGEPIEWQPNKEIIPVTFIGILNGRIVGHVDSMGICTWDVSQVRMAPPAMRTIYLNVHDDRVFAYFYEEDARFLAPKKAKLVAYPVQIPAAK